MNFFEKIIGFLMKPSKTFDAIKGEKLNEALKYLSIFAAINSTILTVFQASAGISFGLMIGGRNLQRLMGSVQETSAAIIFFILLMISTFIGVIIGVAILHIFVYLVGGRKGIKQTIKVQIYGSTPGFLINWIPTIGLVLYRSNPGLLLGWELAGIFVALWAVIISTLGIRQLHEVKSGEAILAILITVIIGFIFSSIITGFETLVKTLIASLIIKGHP